MQEVLSDVQYQTVIMHYFNEMTVDEIAEVFECSRGTVLSRLNYSRAKMKTLVLYDKRFPSVFVDEFLHPEKVSEESYVKHPNANKRWTRSADQFLLKLHNEGKSVKYIANKMGRSQTSIVMRLNKLNQ